SLDQFGWTWAGGGRPALVLFAGAVLLVMSAGSKNRAVPLLAAGSISAAFALTGHTAGLASPGFAPWVVAGHILIAGFWLGAPATLWPMTTTADAEVLSRTEGFSRIARLFVPLLFASGVYLFWRINGGFEAALTTGYGRLLAAKLVLATIILGLGALNMTLITRQLISDPARGRAALRSTLRIDTILFAVILVLIAAATTFSGPTE
ncbi:MAG: CopD family protein, partial [Alphaproteobacteria bacterium]|nr:CopD family protein [Alphaproteobacteria bacterium]